MKPKNILIDYIKSLLKNTSIVILGLVGLVGSFLVDTIFPNVNPWLYYSILLIVSILAAGYYAYKELHHEKQIEITNLQEENESLSQQVTLITDRQPRININFTNKDNSLTKEITLRLQAKKDSANLESILQNKKQELIKKFDLENKNISISRIAFANLGQNPYEQIEEYINSLREYYQNLDQWELFNQKGFLIYPTFKNIGHATANNITIELTTSHKDIILTGEKYVDVNLALNGEEFKPSPPKEPIPWEISFGSFHESMYMMNTDLHNTSLPEFNVSYPEYSINNREAIVVYKIKKLVQGISENEIEPFLIWLGDISENTSLHFQVRIYAEEIMPSPQLDELYIHVILE